jgi:hypothetical protein
MGSGGSKQSVKQENNIVTDVLTDVIVDISSRCDTSSLSKQNLNNNTFIFSGISGSSLDVQAVQNARLSLNAMCTSGNETQSKLINEFESKLKSTVDQKMDGLGIANTNEIDKINNIVSIIKTNVNMKSLTECLAKVSNDQEMFNNLIKFENINNSDIKFSVSQYVVNKVVNSCVLTNASLSSSITDLQNELEDKTTQSNTGFNLNQVVSDVVNGITSVVNNIVDTIGLMWTIIFGIIIVVLVFAPKILCIIPGSQLLLGSLCSSNTNKQVQNRPLPNYQSA